MYATSARRPLAPRSKRTRTWLRRESIETMMAITDEISKLKAETWSHLVDGGLSESDADAVIAAVLRGEAGYRGTERLDWARRQLAAVRALILAAPAYPQQEA